MRKYPPYNHVAGGLSISLPACSSSSTYWTECTRRNVEIITTASTSCNSLSCLQLILVINWRQMRFNWFCSCEGAELEEVQDNEEKSAEEGAVYKHLNQSRRSRKHFSSLNIWNVYLQQVIPSQEHHIWEWSVTSVFTCRAYAFV